MASTLASKVSWPKPVFLMEILASSTASGKTVPSPPPAISPAPEDHGVKDSADPRFATRAGGAATGGWWVLEDGDAVRLKVAMPGLEKENAKMRTEKNVMVIKGMGASQAFKMDQIKTEMKFGSFRRHFSSGGAPGSDDDDGVKGAATGGWWVLHGDAVQLKVAMPGLGKEDVKRAEKNVTFRRPFSSGGAPPHHSDDDGVKDSAAAAAAAAAALEFSDGEEPRTDCDDDLCCRGGDFVVRLPRGALWKAREYPECTRLKVVVPGRMGKDIQMDMFWSGHVDEFNEEEELQIAIGEKLKWEIEEEMEGGETEENPAWWNGDGICFEEDKYDKEEITAEIENGVVVVTVPKILPEDE